MAFLGAVEYSVAFLVSVPLGDSLSFVFGVWSAQCVVTADSSLTRMSLVALKEGVLVFFLALSTLFGASSVS